MDGWEDGWKMDGFTGSTGWMNGCMDGWTDREIQDR